MQAALGKTWFHSSKTLLVVRRMGRSGSGGSPPRRADRHSVRRRTDSRPRRWRGGWDWYSGAAGARARRWSPVPRGHGAHVGGECKARGVALQDRLVGEVLEQHGFAQAVGSDEHDVGGLLDEGERDFEGLTLQIPADRHRHYYVKAKVRVHRYRGRCLGVFDGCPRRSAHSSRSWTRIDVSSRAREPRSEVSPTQCGRASSAVHHAGGSGFLMMI